MFFEKLLQTPLVLQQFHEILLIPEFPCHIAGSPQAAKTIAQSFFNGIFQQGQHSAAVKLSIDQVTLIAREHQCSSFHLVG